MQALVTQVAESPTAGTYTGARTNIVVLIPRASFESSGRILSCWGFGMHKGRDKMLSEGGECACVVAAFFLFLLVDVGGGLGCNFFTGRWGEEGYNVGAQAEGPDSAKRHV